MQENNGDLAPYFPCDKAQELVESVFGINNVMCMVQLVPVENQRHLVDSLICEAMCRRQDPVLGMLGELQRALERERQGLERERLALEREQKSLERERLCREREQQGLEREQQALERELVFLEKEGRFQQVQVQRREIQALESEQQLQMKMQGLLRREWQALGAQRSQREADQRLQGEIHRRWASQPPSSSRDPPAGH